MHTPVTPYIVVFFSEDKIHFCLDHASSVLPKCHHAQHLASALCDLQLKHITSIHT